MITPQYLQSILDYDGESGQLFWKVSNGRKVKGALLNPKYTVSIHRNGQRYSMKYARVCWMVHTGEECPEIVDHIDGNPHNHAWNNLRGATHRLNQYNKVKPMGGVVELKDATRSKPFRAVIRLPGRITKKNLGHYATREAAQAAYETYAKQLHGEFYWKG